MQSLAARVWRGFRRSGAWAGAAPRRPTAVLLLALAAALAGPADGHAGAFRIIDQGAAAAGQGAAFVAQADDPSAIYYNPAGMTQLRGVQTYVGATFVGGTTDFTSDAGRNATGTFNGSVAWPPPTNVYVTANLKDLGIKFLGDTTVGIGALSPFGSLSRWPDNGPFNTKTTFAALPLIDIKPTIAYKLNDQLSIGLGMDIYTFSRLYGKGQSVSKLNWPGGSGIPAGTPTEVNGRDTSLGFNASFLYTPLRNADGKPLANIGFQYRSQATLHLDGNFLLNGGLNSAATSTLVLPQVFTGGIALWPVRDRAREWKIELDVDYTGWKSVRNTDVHLSSGATLPFPQNWRSIYTVMVGTEYRFLEIEKLPDWELALRAGYWNSQSPIPNQTFTPAVPDADNNAISVGMGVLCKGTAQFLGLFDCGNEGKSKLHPSSVGLDIAYQAILFDQRSVTGSSNPTVDGLYKTTYQVGMVNLRVNF